jgi:aminoglycoside phosphotransferase (APT) family kinase protein
LPSPCERSFDPKRRTKLNQMTLRTPQIHPAFAAWRCLHPQSPPPRAIVTLKERSQKGAYRIDGVGPEGKSIIAKRAVRRRALVERTVYEQLLPQLPVRCADYYGHVDEQATPITWLFVSFVDGEPYTATKSEHRILAGRWLAQLHETSSAIASAAAGLPERGPGAYLVRLQNARDRIVQNLDNPVLDAKHRSMLTVTVDQCNLLESYWDQIDHSCARAPRVLLHGDFAPKNMLVVDDQDEPYLMPFDFGSAGWGVAADDLAQPADDSDRRWWVGADLEAYRGTISNCWPELDAQTLSVLGKIGRAFRAITCIDLDALCLDSSWAERIVEKITAYRTHIDSALRGLGWGPGIGPRVPGYRIPPHNLLQRGLTSVFRDAGLAHIGVTYLKRHSNVYASTFPSEFVTCQLDHRPSHITLFCKYAQNEGDGCFGHRGNADYEAQVYRQLLAPLGANVPRFYGEFWDAVAKRTWLVIERIMYSERVAEAVDSATAMACAARWIGHFHAAVERSPIVKAARLLNCHDEAYYIGWIRRTSEFARPLRRYLWLEQLCDHGEELIAPLLKAPKTMVHGEYYPHNVLIREEQAFPIDWQSAAWAAGELDLAALTQKWPADISRQCIEEYSKARWPEGVPANFDAVLDAARYHLVFRWLGDRPRWTSGARAEWSFAQLGELAAKLGILTEHAV